MIDVEIEDAAWTAAVPDAAALARQAAMAAARPRAEETIAILLTDDETVRALNRRFRGQEAATNVLSFPATVSHADHLGDIALAFGVCAREADEQAKPLADHLRHLVIHGVLHLMGYDHVAGDEAETMEAIERDLLAALGVADPYASDRFTPDPLVQGDHVQPRR
ncbi:MAG: rRNA maturation RNase YbeY [Caulobacteraceae bacterium]